MIPNFKKDIFDELLELVPERYRDNFNRLLRRLRNLDPNDEILLIVWGMALFTLIITNQCKSLAHLLVSIKAVTKDFEWKITDAILAVHRPDILAPRSFTVTITPASSLPPESSASADVAGTVGSVAPLDPSVAERLGEIEKRNKMIFCVMIGTAILLGILVNFLGLLVTGQGPH